jgi:hypothetical protein
MPSLFGITRLQAVHPKRLQAEWRELIGRHPKLSERRIQQLHSIEQVADEFFARAAAFRHAHDFERKEL